MAGMNRFFNAIRAVSGEVTPSRAVATGALFLGFAVFDGARNDASALPSFARQTGQTCSTCHTAFPQLTPYGRRFKLGGYTAGGGIDTQLPPLSVMVQSEFTNLGRGLNAPAGSTSAYVAPQPPGLGGYNDTNNWTDLSTQVSLFYGGKVYGNLGAFMQWTYSQDYGQQVSWDNTDVRYADTFHIGPFDVLWGLDFNNNPTVQDPWNTTPAWGVPFISSPFAPGPAASTLLEGSQGWGPGQVVGAGGYVFINDMVYLELTGYGATSKSFQWAVTGGPPGNLLSGVAPYYRVAVEKNWGEHSLEIGAYGINANVITGGNQALPVGTFGWPTDVITDTGLDLQYQWITRCSRSDPARELHLRAAGAVLQRAAGHFRQQHGLSAQPEAVRRICLPEHLCADRDLFQHQRHGGPGALCAERQFLAQFGRLDLRRLLPAVLAGRAVVLAVGQCAHRPQLYALHKVQWREQQHRPDRRRRERDHPLQRRQHDPLLPERQQQQYLAGLRLAHVVSRAAEQGVNREGPRRA